MSEPTPMPESSATPAAPAKKSKVVPITVASVLGVALIGTGIAWGAGAFKGGGGAQPSSVVPADSPMYMSVDLNPTNAQKAEAIKYASKFPAVKSQNLSESSDVKKVIFTEVQKQSKDEAITKLDYDKDIKPWLGDRAALSEVLDANGKAEPVWILAVTDKGKAEATLKGDQDTKCTVLSEFAVCTKPELVDKAYVTDPAKSIEKAPNFNEDLAAVSGDSIATIWVDNAKAQAANKSSSSSSTSAMMPVVDGRTAAKVRMADGTAEMAGVVRGSTAATQISATPGTNIDKVSSDAIAVVSVNGLGEVVNKNWDKIEKQAGGSLDTQAQQLGLTLPGDLVNTLGKQTAIVFGGTNGSQAPNLALISDGDSKALDTLSAKARGMLTVKKDGTTLVGAMGSGYGDKAATGGLSKAPAFTAAVPDASKANSVVYVDVDKLLTSVGTGSMTTEQRDNLGVLKSAGLSSTTADKDGVFKLRVTQK